MATLTTAQTAYLTSELGTPSNDDLLDWQTRYSRLNDVRAVATEILRQRLAELIAQPATVRLPDGTSVGTGPNITALQEQLRRVASESEPGDEGELGGDFQRIEICARPVR